MDAQTLLNNPLLAAFGALVLLAVIVAPISLRVAGLTGAQIVQLLKAIMAFIVELIRSYRASNKKE